MNDAIHPSAPSPRLKERPKANPSQPNAERPPRPSFPMIAARKCVKAHPMITGPEGDAVQSNGDGKWVCFVSRESDGS